MVHRVAESWTWLKQLSAHTHTCINHPHFLKGNQYSQRECLHSYDYFLGPDYEEPRVRKNSVGCQKLQRLIPTVIIPYFPSKLAINFLGHRTCPYTLIPCWLLCRQRPLLLRKPKSRQEQSQNIPPTNNTQSFLGYNHTPCLWPQEKVTIRLRISCLSPSLFQGFSVPLMNSSDLACISKGLDMLHCILGWRNSQRYRCSDNSCLFHYILRNTDAAIIIAMLLYKVSYTYNLLTK